MGDELDRRIRSQREQAIRDAKGRPIRRSKTTIGLDDTKEIESPFPNPEEVMEAEGATGDPWKQKHPPNVGTKRAPRKPDIPAGIRPVRLVNELTKEQHAELDAMGGTRADWDEFIERKGKRRMSSIGPNKIDEAVLSRPTTDTTLRAAGAVLMRELRELVVGVKFSNDPEPVAFVSQRMENAIIEAYKILRGVDPAETWRHYFMARLLKAKIVAVESEQGVALAEELTMADPVAILDGARADCRRAGFPEPPPWLTREIVAWLLIQFNPGGGGGPARKLSGSAIEALIAKPMLLADAIERRQRSDAFKELAQSLRAALGRGRNFPTKKSKVT